MKIFISADIEGTTGIAHWDETTPEQPDFHHYQYFARQMTAEVNAACLGALDAGAAEVFVKDAHDSARNIDPAQLPEAVRIFRGWAKNPFVMMAGLDESFDGVLFTGYHSGSGTNSNPMSHTMNGKNNHVLINGQMASELLINSWIAAWYKVPVFFVSGDKGLCDWVKTLNPGIRTVAVNEGVGNGVISMHPHAAVRQIRETVTAALKQDPAQLLLKLPDSFDVEISFKEHFRAYQGSFYPGAHQTGNRTVAFSAGDYLDVLRFLFYVL